MNLQFSFHNFLSDRFEVFNPKTGLFLAAISSSRSDSVSNAVRVSVRSCVRAFVRSCVRVKHFSILLFRCCYYVLDAS